MFNIFKRKTNTDKLEERIAMLENRLKGIEAGDCNDHEIQLSTLWDTIAVIFRYLDEKKIVAMDDLIASFRNVGEHRSADSVFLMSFPDFVNIVRMDKDDIVKLFDIQYENGNQVKCEPVS